MMEQVRHGGIYLCMSQGIVTVEDYINTRIAHLREIVSHSMIDMDVQKPETRQYCLTELARELKLLSCRVATMKSEAAIEQQPASTNYQ